MFVVGLQHVLVMYAGAIAVPLIVAGALYLAKPQTAALIDADLFACGLVTLLQCLGLFGFGIRLPVVMGVTFAAVGPIVAIAGTGLGLPAIYGAVIASGLFAVAIAPVFGRCVRFFPPVVTGTIIVTIGITLLGVGIAWAGGGPGASDFGAARNLGLAVLVLGTIVAVNRFASGFLANISVLIGLCVGFVAALALGIVDFGGVASANAIEFVRPFRYGPPRFEAGAIVSMCIVMVVTLVESTGMFLALGEICERPVDHRALVRGLRADGAGAIVGGLLNPFPYTSFSQNVGLVQMTGVRSRFAVATSGVILIALGLCPKLATIVASIPYAVLGGAGLAMFGMVAATGIQILASTGLRGRGDLLVVAVSLGIGMIPLVSPTMFAHTATWAQPFLRSGITLAAVTAVGLNLLAGGKQGPSGSARP
jgi:NCS2 family nucleobase:cation symporter-2